MKKILITGACGFVGFHLSKKLCEIGYSIVGIDNFIGDNKQLMKSRLIILKKYKNFHFRKIDLSKNFDKKIKSKYYAIVHLAAKPGVRQSQKNSKIYFENNIVCFYNVIQFAKKNSSIFLYASSSSIYGDNQKKNVGSIESYTKIKSLSFYAFTKEINEKFANFYSDKSFKCFGLRFFSVYGNYGRPDMAYFKFPLNALKYKKINLNNSGNDYRDFTHISDIVTGIEKLIISAKKIKKSEVFNFGTNKPIRVKKIIELIKLNSNLKLILINKKKNNLDPQVTNANIKRAKKIFGYNPIVKFEVGYKDFLEWFLRYYKTK
jgi:UDP-glucuronate 4-epimerase